MPPKRLILLAGALLVLLAATWIVPPDDAARVHVDAGFKRALATFAAARALNAVISVAQGTELAVQPAGVGVNFTPGQALDPINDLVEQFSSLMLAASAAFGVQLVLIEIGRWWPLSLLLTGIALAWGWWQWRRGEAPRWLSRLLLGMLFVRFAVPLVALGSEAAFQLFMKNDYAAAQRTIERSTDEIAARNPPQAQNPVGRNWLEILRDWWSKVPDVGKLYDELRQIAGNTIEQIVKLIVVFMLQTLVLPLLFGWAMLRIGAALLEPRSRER